jgi:phage gpG-like protein
MAGKARDLPGDLRYIGLLVLDQIRFNLSGVILNRRTGNLWRSYKSKVTKISTDWYRLTTYSDLPYARIHDVGGWAGRNHAAYIPKRPYHIRAWVERKVVIKKRMEFRIASIVKG